MSSVLENTMNTEVAFDSIGFLRDLVAIQSYSGKEANAANYIV